MFASVLLALVAPSVGSSCVKAVLKRVLGLKVHVSHPVLYPTRTCEQLSACRVRRESACSRDRFFDDMVGTYRKRLSKFVYYKTPAADLERSPTTTTSPPRLLAAPPMPASALLSPASRLRELERKRFHEDRKGRIPVMDAETLRELCLESDGFETPALNDNLCVASSRTRSQLCVPPSLSARLFTC